MICRGCGNPEAYHKHGVWNDGEIEETCNACSNLRLSDAGSPDVYFSHIGQKFDNLTDKMGRPIEIQSKRHKKQVMDKLGVREAGHTVNGVPYGTKTWNEGTRAYRKKQFDKERPMIRETLRKWKEKAAK